MHKWIDEVNKRVKVLEDVEIVKDIFSILN